MKCLIPSRYHFSVDTMKFGATYEEYLRLEQDKYLGQCSRVEYKRLKKVLKKCRVGRSLQADGANGDEKHQGSDEYSGVCECNSCTCMSLTFSPTRQTMHNSFIFCFMKLLYEDTIIFFFLVSNHPFAFDC